MVWTVFGLKRGEATTRWPRADADQAGQRGVEQLPAFHPERCVQGCARCVDVCLPQAITADIPHIALDLGRCIGCRLCVDECPSGALSAGTDFDTAVTQREDLRWTQTPEARELQDRVQRAFRGSLHIRHVDAGSCNGCESELKALNNPFYNLHRLGIFFTPSPRFADLLLVTGTQTYAMREALANTLEAIPRPRWVMAVGACAISGGPVRGGYASGHGLDGELEVDVWVPGCPPSPAAVIHGLLLLLRRAPQRMRGGQHGE